MILYFCHCASLTAHDKMVAVKKSFCRNLIKMTLIEGKHYWNFPYRFFSGSDEPQSVGNVPYVSGTRVAELNFLTEAFDSGCCAEPLLS